MRNLVLIITAAFVLSCEDATFERTYLIRQGEHYATNKGVEALQSNTLEFYATFDRTAMYDLGDNALQSNKNKLMGFSDCNSLHHENSARFAWQWYGGKLEIFAYCYANGARMEQYIGTVGIGKKNKYSIRCMPGRYEFKLNNQEIVKIERGTTCDKGFYYMLWPYFGGAIPAPHDITILIERIY
ncbi:MAG TPA: hypothetical protein VGD40_20850 [Chryseosolibacter sp.]